MTNNSVFSRRACAERVTIQADGSIPKVEQTSLGFQTSLDPYQITPADIACVLKGGSYVAELDHDTRPVIHNKNSSVVGFKYFDFGKPASLSGSLRVRGGEVALPHQGAIRPTRRSTGRNWRVGHQGRPVGNIAVVSTEVKPVSGRAAVFFTVSSDSPDRFTSDLLSFRFQKQ